MRRRILGMSYRYPDPNAFAPTKDELDAARTAAGAGGQGSAWGAGIGSVLGGLAGLIPLATGLGAAALPVTIPAGLAAGGALGSAIGGSLGNATANGAAEKVDAGTSARNLALQRLQMHQAALDELMNTK